MSAIGMDCPQCGTRAYVRSSRPMSATMRELLFQCRVVACSASWVATLEVARMLAIGGLPDKKLAPLSDRAEIERLIANADSDPR